MTKAKPWEGHTPTPWRLQEGYNNIYALSDGDSGLTIAIATCHSHQVTGRCEEAETNAHYITHAVNNFHEVTEALRELLDDIKARAKIGHHHPNEAIRQYFTGSNGEVVINAGNGVLANAERALRLADGEA